MNSALSRLNGLFAFTLTVVGSITFMCFLSTAFVDRSVKDASADVSPSHTINVNSIPTRWARSGSDMASFLLDISANFSHMFDWNTKQLFVYVVAEYQGNKQPVNEVVLWDKIILRGQDAILNIHSAQPKYPFIDYGQVLRGNKNVSLYLRWNVVPLAGKLPLVYSRANIVRFPSQYSS